MIYAVKRAVVHRGAVRSARDENDFCIRCLTEQTFYTFLFVG